MSDLPEGFKLKDLQPLRWVHLKGTHDMQFWLASTPVGRYSVRKMGNRVNWDYSLYTGSCLTECESVEAGMGAAWEHWKNLVRQIIEPHPLEGTIVRPSPMDPPSGEAS